MRVVITRIAVGGENVLFHLGGDVTLVRALLRSANLRLRESTLHRARCLGAVLYVVGQR